MFKLNLKIALRNLWKNKAYTAINVFGLAAGLAGFMMILLYINKETGYDKWDPALKDTYIVAADFTKNGAQNKGSKIKGLLSQVLSEQINEVEAVSIGSLDGRTTELKYAAFQKEVKLRLPYARVDSNFFKVYPLQPMYGQMEEVFKGVDAIAISYTAAIKLFGRADVVNQELIQNRGVNAPEARLIVKAVWDDRKQPSSFDFGIITFDDLKDYGNQIAGTTFSTIFKLRKGVDAEQTLQKINDAYIVNLAKLATENSDPKIWPSKAQALQLLQEKEGITAIKLITQNLSGLNLSDFYTTNPKQRTIYILSALASFLIIISCINYTNLALVLAHARAKEVGVKKVLGAFRWSLIKQFFAETTIQCVMSFLVSLILVELLLPKINVILDSDLSLFSSTAIGLMFGQITLILVAVMLLSGAYPAIVLAGFLPAKVLKGNFSTAVHIGNVRKMLVVFQFTVAIALIIGFGVMYAQLNFMKQKDLGLKTDQLMSVTIAKYEKRTLNPPRFEAIKNRLLAIKGVEGVTRSTEQPINDSGFEDDISFNHTTLSVESRYIDPNYLTVIGAKVLKGRNFSDQLLGTDSVQSIILNQTAFQQLGLTTNDQQIEIDRNGDKVKMNVVGVVEDIKAYGFEKPVSPTIYLVSGYPSYWRKNVVFRLNTQHISETLADIKTAWKEIDPGAEPNFVFVDQVFAKMNAHYELSQNVIFAFGMVTLIVSIFGLIGFAAYNTKIRVKEIAIRRVLGASTTSILKTLNSNFIKLVIIATLFADVLAYIYMQKWFDGFTYRINMPFMVFALVNLFIVLVTMLTISLQSIAAVKANPVKALKYE